MMQKHFFETPLDVRALRHGKADTIRKAKLITRFPGSVGTKRRRMLRLPGRACPHFPSGMRLRLLTWAVTPFKKAISPPRSLLLSERLRDWAGTVRMTWPAT